MKARIVRFVYIVNTFKNHYFSIHPPFYNVI